jgi:hypothetical protein
MDDAAAKNEITQKEFDALLKEVLTAADKTAPYWQQQEKVFTLDLALLLEYKGFSTRLFPREIKLDPPKEDIQIRVSAANCKDKPLLLSAADKRAIQESIGEGAYKITLDKFRELMGVQNLFSPQELKELYDDFKSFRRGGALTQYAEIIFEKNPNIDPLRVKQKQDARKDQATIGLFFLRQANDGEKRLRSEQEFEQKDKSTKTARSKSPDRK